MIKYEIRENDIRHNVNIVLHRAGVPVWGVLKYNGYGMGLLPMTHLLKESGITRFAVNDAGEAYALRNAGFETEDILLLSPQISERDMELGLRSRAIFSVGSAFYANLLINCARKHSALLWVHIALDTGLGRFGFLPSQYEEVKALYLSQNMWVEGIYSHFSCAGKHRQRTLLQYRRFQNFTERLRSDGIDPGMTHISNSAALFRYGNMSQQSVRVGSALVGRVAGTDPSGTGLRSVGRLCADVIDVRTLPKGSTIGYGCEIRLPGDSRIAVLHAGKGAGVASVSRINRAFRRFPQAEINGQYANLIATNSTCYTFADVTGLQVNTGDVAHIDVNPLCVDSGIERCYLSLVSQ